MLFDEDKLKDALSKLILQSKPFDEDKLKEAIATFFDEANPVRPVHNETTSTIYNIAEAFNGEKYITGKGK
ncbi:MAG: hypothetical protein ACRDL7_13180 [Gaiellaceae bacterium]